MRGVDPRDAESLERICPRFDRRIPFRICKDGCLIKTNQFTSSLQFQLAAVGIIVFVKKYYSHEIIKSSSRELSVFIWIGAVVAHFNTFLVFFTAPNNVSCGVIR